MIAQPHHRSFAELFFNMRERCSKRLVFFGGQGVWSVALLFHSSSCLRDRILKRAALINTRRFSEPGVSHSRAGGAALRPLEHFSVRLPKGQARGDTGQAAEKCSSPILPVRSGIASGGEQGGRWRLFPCRFYRRCRQYRGAPRDSRAQTAPENTRR